LEKKGVQRSDGKSQGMKRFLAKSKKNMEVIGGTGLCQRHMLIGGVQRLRKKTTMGGGHKLFANRENLTGVKDADSLHPEAIPSWKRARWGKKNTGEGGGQGGTKALSRSNRGEALDPERRISKDCTD